MLADGHVLLEDVPGLAKTLTARSFAEASGLGFSRVQFTPDLLPADVTGSSIWNQRDADFEFRAGPIFTHLLLADEINRAPPKTQAALLEAMQERQVTTDGVTRPLRAPVPRPRDPESDRVRRHLSAPRGAARPLPAPHRVRLSRRGRRVGDAGAPHRAPRGRSRADPGDRPADAARDAGGGGARPRRSHPSGATSSPSWRRRARARALPSAPARVAASRCSSSPGAGPPSPDATSSPRTT